MATKTGCVSSFDEWQGVGFIRPTDDPKRLVKFHRTAVADDAANDIRPGLEVAYDIGPDDEAAGGRPVARSVEISRPDAEDVETTDPMVADADPL